MENPSENFEIIDEKENLQNEHSIGMVQSEELLNAFSELYRIGIENISLPKICIIGDQSTGKSSVIESISGINLPRGTGVVTRLPTIIQMKRREKESVIFESKILEGNDELCDAILRKQNEICGVNKGIKDEPIKIEIHSPNVFNLTIIDLPGLVRVAIEDQPEDIGEIVKEMILKYVKDAQTIMLVVIPAESDIATVEAINIARNVDKEGVRTIGVVTKVDRAPEKGDVISILNQEKVKMKLGIFGVRNRNNEELKNKISLKEAREIEKQFFERNYPDHSDLCGIEKLGSVLSDILQENMRESFPDIQKKMNERLRICKNELMKLGRKLPDTVSGKTFYVIKLIREISEVFNKIITGNYFSLAEFIDEKLLKKSPVNEISISFTDFGKSIEDTRIPVEEEDFGKVLLKNMEEAKAGKLPGFLPYSVFVRIILEQNKKFKDPTFNCFRKICSILEKVGKSVIEDKCYQFIQLKSVFFVNFLKFFEDTKKLTEKNLNFELEKQNHLFTNNHYYLDTLGKKRLEHIKKKMHKEVGEEKKQLPNPIFGQKKEEMNLNKLSIKCQEEEEMKFRLEAFFKVIKKRVMDEVPLTISYFLIKKMKEDLFDELMLYFTENKDMIKLIQERPRIASRRKGLEREIGNLNRGLIVIEQIKFS